VGLHPAQPGRRRPRAGLRCCPRLRRPPVRARLIASEVEPMKLRKVLRKPGTPR
jgi:hypothetical protein